MHNTLKIVQIKDQSTVVENKSVATKKKVSLSRIVTAVFNGPVGERKERAARSFQVLMVASGLRFPGTSLMSDANRNRGRPRALP